MSDNGFLLTQFSEAGGCGCKISPTGLQELLGNQTEVSDSNLLIGFSDKDDASVYKISADEALISSIDFFSPIVNDPYHFGAIASANSISDIYAMGGRPIFALNILGWPTNIPLEIARKVIKGARDKCAEAGISIVGGHSIKNTQPIFGLAVNGLAKLSNIKRNNGAKAGNLLFLTKPLGTGIYASAERKGLLKEQDREQSLMVSLQLNDIGASLGEFDYVTTMTDITGFGLFGHLLEICKASKLDAELYFDNIPVLDGMSYYLDRQIATSGGKKNWNSYSEHVDHADLEEQIILSDPQTNGGLLIAVEESKKQAFTAFLRKHNLGLFTEPIGKLLPKSESPSESKIYL